MRREGRTETENWSLRFPLQNPSSAGWLASWLTRTGLPYFRQSQSFDAVFDALSLLLILLSRHSFFQEDLVAFPLDLSIARILHYPSVLLPRRAGES